MYLICIVKILFSLVHCIPGQVVQSRTELSGGQRQFQIHSLAYLRFIDKPVLLVSSLARFSAPLIHILVEFLSVFSMYAQLVFVSD